jgi:hypothetical protein
MQNLNPLFEFNVNLDVIMVWDHLMTRILGDGMSNLERRAVWKKDVLLSGLGDLMKMWISRANAKLQMLQNTVHGILMKSVHLKPYKLQVVQKLTACDKQLRLQFVAHVCPNLGT